MKKILLSILLYIFTVFWMVGTTNATPVDLELLLAVDVSGSINSTEFDLQRDGYEAAFRDADIINAIMNGPDYQSIAVGLMYWSSSNQQVMSVDWTQLSDGTSSNAFADAIAAAARPYQNQTGIGEALRFGAGEFSSDNGFEGTRLVLDLSGDGVHNEDYSVANGRQDAIAAGVDSINALAIQSTSLETYFANNVIYNGSTWFASDFTTFGAAVRSKILTEIQNPVPEPATMLLFGAGLVGLAGSRIRKKKK